MGRVPQPHANRGLILGEWRAKRGRGARPVLVPDLPDGRCRTGSSTGGADLTEATAETLSFARRLDLDPAEIVDLLQSTPLGAPYAVQKARSMLAGDFRPAFALKHALKDAELAAQAAQATGATLTLTSALLPRWREAAAGGHADDDLSAVWRLVEMSLGGAACSLGSVMCRP
jgi:NAD-binding of NADP-dependent 3-hydroxyisobutyrate dehydrogenase